MDIEYKLKILIYIIAVNILLYKTCILICLFANYFIIIDKKLSVNKLFIMSQGLISLIIYFVK